MTDLGSITHNSNRGVRVLKHLLFWSLFVLYNIVVWGAYDQSVYQSVTTELVALPAKIFMVYITLYFLIPKFLLPKKYLEFIFWTVVGLSISGIANRVMTYFVIYPRYLPEAVGSPFWNVKVFFEITIVGNISALAAAIKLLQHFYKNERSREQLAQEKLDAELKLLKSQVHPHFLFNTLNSLYALTLDNSPMAPDLVLKLSSLLSYMLYECNVPLVSLEKEAVYLENYISIEKFRYGDKLDLSFEIDGDIKQYSIAPLILLPFVENSFKHGVSHIAEQSWISCNLWVAKGFLHFQIDNSIVDTDAGVTETREEYSYMNGIGLSNVKQRLQLLYPDRYELTVRKEDSFRVILKLKLDSLDL